MLLQGSLSIERMCQLVPVSRRSFYRSLKEAAENEAGDARQLQTSRSQLDRLLDPRNVSVSLETMTRAARALGKRVIIRVADAKAARRA